MRPPADRQLNLHGTGTDVPAVAPLRYGVHWSIIFIAASLLALFSSLMAWRFTVSLGRDVTYWRTLVILNTSYFASSVNSARKKSISGSSGRASGAPSWSTFRRSSFFR